MHYVIQKEHLLCVQRDIFICKNEKQSKNIIWILWDIILKLSNDKNHQIKIDIIKILFLNYFV